MGQESQTREEEGVKREGLNEREGGEREMLRQRDVQN